MKIYGTILCLFLAATFLCSCKSFPKDPSGYKFLGREMWTATNLRLFNHRNIYWQNFQNGPVLPVGTYIRFEEITTHTATFVDSEDHEFTIYWLGQGKNYKDVFEREAHKYFTYDNPNEKLKKLSEDQLKTVEIGKLEEGMTKRLVLFSCGFPVDMEEPMKHDTWFYWLTPEQKCAVQFENGQVVQIIR